MDWWLWLVGVLLLLLLVGIVWVRLRRPRLRDTVPEAWRDRPRPGEIWWAEVPFEDGPGSKVRPCVVLRTYRGHSEVLKITSQERHGRRGHIEIPTRTWDRKADHNSYLDLTGPLRVRRAKFSRKAGTLDDTTWRLVRQGHRTGWVA